MLLVGFEKGHLSPSVFLGDLFWPDYINRRFNLLTYLVVVAGWLATQVPSLTVFGECGRSILTHSIRRRRRLCCLMSHTVWTTAVQSDTAAAAASTAPMSSSMESSSWSLDVDGSLFATALPAWRLRNVRSVIRLVTGQVTHELAPPMLVSIVAAVDLSAYLRRLCIQQLF